jgi:hypothetical protein
MSKIDNILRREMTRQQFLVTIGMSMVSLVGFSALMGILTGDDSKTNKNGPPPYGVQNYGP